MYITNIIYINTNIIKKNTIGVNPMQITSMLMKDSFFSSFLVLLINFPFNSVPMFVTIMLHGLGLDERQRFGHFCLLYPLSL